jgi:hypothetical protein
MSSMNLIGDTKSVISNGPNSTTQANAIAAAGPIMDYPGNVNLMLTKFQECNNILTRVKQDTDASDSTNLTLINKVLALLNGTSTPSTTALADLQTVYNNGPNATSQADAIAAAGPILDYPGMVKQARRVLEEVKELIGYIITDTAAGDTTNLGLLNGILAVLV